MTRSRLRDGNTTSSSGGFRLKRSRRQCWLVPSVDLRLSDCVRTSSPSDTRIRVIRGSRILGALMKDLIRLRRLAFELQQGRCFYCRTPMWLEHPRDVFGHRGLSSKVAGYLKCTAEHLKPVSEGGKDEPDNIVAACQFCNRTRHRAKKVLSPERYATRVQTRVALGRWHVAAIGHVPIAGEL